jgi:hypothetical protein
MIQLADHLKNISASERVKIADTIEAWATTATPNEKAALIEALSKPTEVDRVQAAADRKRVALAKISAAKETIGGLNLFSLTAGALRRGGLPPIESLVGREPHEIDALLASSKMETLDKMSLKRVLFSIGAYPQ